VRRDLWGPKGRQARKDPQDSGPCWRTGALGRRGIGPQGRLDRRATRAFRLSRDRGSFRTQAIPTSPQVRSSRSTLDAPATFYSIMEEFSRRPRRQPPASAWRWIISRRSTELPPRSTGASCERSTNRRHPLHGQASVMTSAPVDSRGRSSTIQALRERHDRFSLGAPPVVKSRDCDLRSSRWFDSCVAMAMPRSRRLSDFSESGRPCS